jgi:hypothetical protein
MRIRHLSPRIAPLLSVGCGMVGGAVGYLIGSLGDTILAIDTRIVGVVLGAVLGSLLPRTPALGTLTYAAAAGIGVAATTFPLVVSGRAAPDVVWGVIIVAAIGSAGMNIVVRRIRWEQN